MASIIKADVWQNGAGVTYGTVLQTVNAQYTSPHISTTSTAYQTTAQTVTITPKFATSKILILVNIGMCLSQNASALVTSITRNGTVLTATDYGLAYNCNTATGPWEYHPRSMSYMDAPNTTSAVVYEYVYRSVISGQTVYGSHSGCMNILTALEIAQ